MKVVLALGLLALMQSASARPQFSVFNRQLFPDFSFRGQSPRRPAVQFSPVQRPERPRFVSRPAPQPAPQRFVPQPTFTSFNRPIFR